MVSRTKAGRKKEQLTYSYIIGDKNRLKILEICKNPKSFGQLKKDMNISTGSLFHHLTILLKLHVIKKKKIKENGHFKRGQEISLSTDLDMLERLKLEDEKNITSQGIFPEYYTEEKEELILLDIFKIIENTQINQDRFPEFFEIRKKLDPEDYNMDMDDLISFFDSTLMNNLHLFLFGINKQGEMKYNKLKEKINKN